MENPTDKYIEDNNHYSTNEKFLVEVFAYYDGAEQKAALGITCYKIEEIIDSLVVGGKVVICRDFRGERQVIHFNENIHRFSDTPVKRGGIED